MRHGRASQTASMVAFLRALADAGLTHLKDFSDPTARRFLSPGWARLLRRVERSTRRRREVLVSAADLLAMRTRVIDRHLQEALAQGVSQVVILGAGLDGRAFRMKELGAVHVFEVDHPSTQAVKRERAVVIQTEARELTFVPVNFERDSLGRALEQAGHLAHLPTVWIWEGVVMYLSDTALRGTLKTLSARSAPGSTLIVQYHTHARGHFLGTLLLRWWGEPQIGQRAPEAMAQELRAADFQVVQDWGTEDWARQLQVPLPKFGAARQARVAVARH